MTDYPIRLRFALSKRDRVIKLRLKKSNNIKLRFDNQINVTTSDIPDYEGIYVVDPSATDTIVLETNGKRCTDDITVNKIKTSETHNPYGITYYIAEA